MTATRTSGIAFASGCLLILGFMPLLSNARPAGSDGLVFAIWLTFWQFLAALPLLIWEWRQKPSGAQGKRPGMTSKAVAVALLTSAMFGLSTYMYVIAAEKAGAVNMIITLQAYPLIALLAEAVFLRHRKSAAEVGFTLLVVLALAYLVTGGTFTIANTSLWTLFTLFIPVLWTLAHLMLKRILTTLSVTPSQVTASRLFFSGLFLWLVQIITGHPQDLLAVTADRAFMLAALALGIAYYVELLFWFYAMRTIDVSLASSITVPAPAITMLVTALWLGQPVYLYQIAAMLLASLGIYGLIIAGSKREAAATS
ncbi:MAG: DMT family transporter [Hyphomicrobiales bacterium]